jgi:hypothetical protein
MPSGSFGKVCVYLLPQKRAVGAAKIGGGMQKRSRARSGDRLSHAFSPMVDIAMGLFAHDMQVYFSIFPAHGQLTLPIYGDLSSRSILLNHVCNMPLPRFVPAGDRLCPVGCLRNKGPIAHWIDDGQLNLPMYYVNDRS